MICLKDISEFIFICNEPKKADIIFVPGGSYPEIAEEAARVENSGVTEAATSDSCVFPVIQCIDEKVSFARRRQGKIYSVSMESRITH